MNTNLKKRFLCSLLAILLFLQPSFISIKGLETCNTLTALAASETEPDQTITLYAKGTKNRAKKLQISSKTLNIEQLYFVSSDPSIAKVNRDSGKITAVKKGTATVTAYVTASGKNKIFNVLVKVKNPFVKITKSVKTLKKGKQYTFKAKAYGLKEKIKWSSSNTTVASINASTGKVVAKKVGKTTITAKCGKKSVQTTLQVKKKNQTKS